MKRIILIITAMLALAGTAAANGGACEGDAEKANGKAACEIKKGTATADEAACDMEGAKKKMKQKKHEHMKQMEDSKDNASEKAQQKRRKWWKFWGSDEAAE